jgi:hypothetical protein
MTVVRLIRAVACFFLFFAVIHNVLICHCSKADANSAETDCFEAAEPSHMLRNEGKEFETSLYQ